MPPTALAPLGAFLLTALATSGPAAAAHAVHLRPVAAATIAHRVAAGQPVSERGVSVRGDLVLPAVVRAPLAIRDSSFRGELSGHSTVFRDLVDFSGSSFPHGVDLSEARFGAPFLFAHGRTAKAGRASFAFAVFDAAAVFASAAFAAPVSFSDAVFRGESRFDGATFGRGRFRFATFDRDAHFKGVTFGGATSFAGGDFRGLADFGFSNFMAAASFAAAHFAGQATFTSGHFLGAGRFASARFDGGGDFFGATFADGVTFADGQANGDLVFQGATFDGATTFTRARVLGDVNLSDRAYFGGPLIFTEAQVTKLDLDTARLGSSRVYLPSAHKGGGIGALRMDPADVVHVSVSGTSDRVRKQREHTLKLIEAAARAGGDLGVAAAAGVRRLTLGRQDDSSFVRALDWIFYWQIAGYFLRPWHPLVALALAIVLFKLLKWSLRGMRHDRARRLRSFVARLWKGAAAREPAAAPEPEPAPDAKAEKPKPRSERVIGWVEPKVYRVLGGVLVLAAGNVWPPVAGILKGVLP